MVDAATKSIFLKYEFNQVTPHSFQSRVRTSWHGLTIRCLLLHNKPPQIEWLTTTVIHYFLIILWAGLEIYVQSEYGGISCVGQDGLSRSALGTGVAKGPQFFSTSLSFFIRLDGLLYNMVAAGQHFT